MSDYSPDVEIDHTGTLVAVRDIEEGDLITVPLHMFHRAMANFSKHHIIRTGISHAEWINFYR